MKTENSAEERFDKEFAVYYTGKGHQMGEKDEVIGSPQEVKAFLHQELSTSRLELIKELREKVENRKKCECGRFLGVWPVHVQWCRLNQDGYLQALQEVNEILNSITNEGSV